MFLQQNIFLFNGASRVRQTGWKLSHHLMKSQLIIYCRVHFTNTGYRPIVIQLSPDLLRLRPFAHVIAETALTSPIAKEVQMILQKNLLTHWKSDLSSIIQVKMAVMHSLKIWILLLKQEKH